MSDYLIVDDGYTRDGFIAAIEELHGEIEFSFRPLTRDERDAVNNRMNKKAKGETTTGVMAQVICRQVKEWSIGDVVDLEPGVVKRMHPALLDKLYLIVAGSVPSDPKPDSSDWPGATLAEETDEATDLKN